MIGNRETDSQTISGLKRLVSNKISGASILRGNQLGSCGNVESALEISSPRLVIPYGQLLEITGKESSGKTSFLYQCLAKLTAAGYVAYIDLSNSFFPLAASQSGVNLKQLMIVKASNMREALRKAELLLNRKRTKAIVLDLVNEMQLLPMTLLHRLRMDTVRSRSILIFLTDNSLQIIPSSMVSVRLLVSRSFGPEIVVEVTKSRISGEGLKSKLNTNDYFANSIC